MTDKGSQGMQLESSSSGEEPTVEKYCSDGGDVCSYNDSMCAYMYKRVW